MARLLAAWLLLGMAGCGPESLGSGLLSFGASPPPPRPAQPLPPVPTPADPLLAFAATAQPGGAGTVVLASGQPVQARVLRGYVAASGRECREILLGGGFEERSALACRDAEGWSLARPLLRGGNQRP